MPMDILAISKVAVYGAWIALIVALSLWLYRRQMKRLPRRRELREMREYVSRGGTFARVIWLVSALSVIVGGCLVNCGRHQYGIPLGMLGSIGILVDATVLRPARRRAFAAKLRAEQYRACAACAYSLKGSPANGTCPECGRPFDGSLLVQEWQSVLNSGVSSPSD